MGRVRIGAGVLVLCGALGGLTDAFGGDTDSHRQSSGASKATYIDSQRSWLFWSFLPERDSAETLGVELESYIGWGSYKIKNISYIEIADFPRPIPGQPPGNSNPGFEVRAGVNDLLSGFWLSKRDAPHRRHHLAFGAAFQAPTATIDSLGAGKWSIGPAFDYEYERGRLFAGVIGIQLWSVAGDSDREDVSYFMAKPFVVYSLSRKWDLLYMPYGITIYWSKPPEDAVYLPVGGGVQRHLGPKSNLSLQFFKNVLRPAKGTEYDLRLMLEFVIR